MNTAGSALNEPGRAGMELGWGRGTAEWGGDPWLGQRCSQDGVRMGSGWRWDGRQGRGAVGLSRGWGSEWDRDAVGWGGGPVRGPAPTLPTVLFPLFLLFPSHLAGQEGEAAVGAEQRPRHGAAAVPAALPGARRLLKHPFPCGDRHWVRGSERPEPPQNPRPPAPALPGSPGKVGRRPPGAPLMAQGLWPGGPGAPGPERPGRKLRAPGPAPASRPPLRHPALPWHPCPGIPPLGAQDRGNPDPSDPGIPPPAIPTRCRRGERRESPGAGAPQADGGGGGAATGTPEVQRWDGGTDPGTPSATGGSGIPRTGAAQCRGTPKPRQQRHRRGVRGPSWAHGRRSWSLTHGRSTEPSPPSPTPAPEPSRPRSRRPLPRQVPVDGGPGAA